MCVCVCVLFFANVVDEPSLRRTIGFTATETWERLETGDPKPTARTQLAAVAFNVPLFAAHGGAADVRSKSTPAAAAAAADDDDDDDDGRPTVTYAGLPNRDATTPCASTVTNVGRSLFYG